MLNPGGSVKDRIGLPMIEAAERAGLLKPGGTIIEPTSGNTGHGLAIAAALKGYRCIFVMADKQSAEKQHLLRAYGAEVVLCPTNVPPTRRESYYCVAARLARDIPGAFKPDQYWNAENPAAHERTTGPELWEGTDGRITHFVASVGTGGTISGAAHVLKERNPAIQVIGADPEGSVLSGDTARPYLTEGVGEDFFPGTYDPSLVDRWVRVSDRDAFAMARRLTREEGILSGGSCGTAMVAAREVVRDLTATEAATTRSSSSSCPTAAGATSRSSTTTSGCATTASSPTTGASSGSTTCSAIATTPRIAPARRRGPDHPARRRGDRDPPVVRDQPAAGLRASPTGDAVDGLVGSISEKGLLDRAFRDPSIVERTVGEVMDPPLPLVDAAASLDEAFALLSGRSTGARGDPWRATGRGGHQARPARVPGPPPGSQQLGRDRACPSIRTARFELVSMSLEFMQLLVAGDLDAAAEPRSVRPSRPTCPIDLASFLAVPDRPDLSVDPAASPGSAGRSS